MMYWKCKTAVKIATIVKIAKQTNKQKSTKIVKTAKIKIAETVIKKNFSKMS